MRPGSVGLRVHRDGHGGHQRGLGQFAALQQESPQHPGAQRHDHVVDRHAESVLHALDVPHVELGVGDVAVLAQGAVERRRGRRERCRHRSALARAQQCLRQRQHRRRQQRRQPQRPLREPHQTAHGDLQRVSAARAGDGLRWQLVGLLAAQLGEQVRPGHAVDHGVVHLEHHRHRIFAGATLDHPHLPQRAVAVQRQPGDIATDLGQLAPPSRRRHTDTAYVAPQLETLVVDPHRVIQVQLVVGQLHPKFGHRTHALDHFAAKPAVRVAPRHRRGIQLENAAHIQRLCRCLQVKKECIESTKSLHSRLLD